MRDLFKQAREAGSAIIFIDELDAIGRARGGSTSFGGHSEQEQTLNQILTEMDGFSSGDAVIVLAATNIVRQMVTRWGMSERLGPVALAPRNDGFLDPAEAEAGMAGGWRPYSDDTARLIDAEVRRILDESYAEATQLLRQQRQALDALAKALLDHETLDEQEIRDVTRLRPEPPTGVLPLPVAAFIGNGLSTLT